MRILTHKLVWMRIYCMLECPNPRRCLAHWYFSADTNWGVLKNEPRHDKTNKVSVRPAKTQISLGIRPVWSESSLSAWRKLGSLATHWAHSEDSDHTGWMTRLICVFAGRTLILLVLSYRGSNVSARNARAMYWYQSSHIACKLLLCSCFMALRHFSGHFGRGQLT